MAIITIAGSQAKRQHLASIIDDQMQLESKEPSRGSLAPLGDPMKDPMAADTWVFANRQCGRVDKADSRASAHLGDREGDQVVCHNFHQAIVAQQMRKLLA